MNKTFVILPDVTCDLSEEIRKEFDIEFIKGHYKTPDGQDRVADLTWGDTTSEEFYKQLKLAPNDFATSPPNVQECADAFEERVKNGYGVLALSISSGISGTYNFMVEAAKQVKEKYPDAHIRVIDSMRFSSGFGIIAIYASLLRSEGKTIDEVADWIEENKNRVHQAGWLDDLSFVAKKGRITQAKAFFGTLAGVKPIGEFDYNGLVTSIGKAKGEKQAYKALIGYIGKTIENPGEQIILIATSDRKKQAEVYKAMIEENFHPKAIYVNGVFPSCGINVGPGLMAAYYLGKPISEGLEEERKILTALLAAK